LQGKVVRHFVVRCESEVHTTQGGTLPVKWWKVILLALAYTAVALILLFGVLWLSGHFGSTGAATTLIAALSGALVASLAPVITATLHSLGQQRDRDVCLRDEVSRVALERTRTDYDLRQRALSAGQAQRFLAPAKVYREF
jgi:hypothetical protein